MNSALRLVAVTTVCAGLTVGCATTTDGQQQALGAGAGAALGAGLAALAGGNTTAIVAGALAGGVVGWGTVKMSQYHSAQVRSQAEDRQLYGLTEPATTTTVTVRKGTSTPGTVQPGSQVHAVTDFSLSTPEGTQPPQTVVSWSLWKDGAELTNFPSPKEFREAGGHKVDSFIPIPPDAEPGTYVVKHKVQAGTFYDEDESVFVVPS